MSCKMETLKHTYEMTPLSPECQQTHNVKILVNTIQDLPITQKDKRAAWDGKMQFFLSIIGYSVGLGNIWRFPYFCQQSGGGAFLIPFFIMLILEGIPLFLIELGLGQKMRQSALGVWNTIHPWLGGIGIASCMVTFFVSIYYNVIVTWCFFYLFKSLWAVMKTLFNGEIELRDALEWAKCPVVNGKEVEECTKSSSTAYFWYRTTLDAAPSIEDSEGLKWWIVLCLLLSWIAVFFIVMKGIQSSKNVVYFTSLFPYIVLTIFFVRAVTLKGAGTGLVYMYTPKVEKLLEPTVWLDAATQVFYSFGLAFGSLIAFGSYNQQNNNCVRDVIIVSCCNAFTAIYASAVVFAILGFKAVSNYENCLKSNRRYLEAEGLLNIDANEEKLQGVLNTLNLSSIDLAIETCSVTKELDDAAEGTGLAFIVFAQAIVELPGAPFWSCIFFLMLLALGIGSQIGILEGMLCVIFDIDFFKRIRKQYMTACVCITCFFVGLIFCTGAGEYWLKLFDSFASTIGLVVVALMEMIAVMFVYGHEKFTNDIEQMTGYRPGLYWQITWRFLAPLIMICILISSMISMIVKKPQYSAWSAALGAIVPTDYPDWILAIGICIIIAGIAPIPIVFLMRRFQCVELDVDVHQGSVRRNETTVSTKKIISDVDLDEYHDRTEKLSEDDEVVNSDDDHNTNSQNFKAFANNQHRRKSFEMKAMHS